MLSVMPPLAPLLFRAIDIGWFSRIGSTNAKSEAARASVYCHSQSE